MTATHAGPRPYSAYKESTLSSLPRIPAHWEERRAKYFLCDVDERSTTGSETLLSLRQLHGLIPHIDVSNKIITSEQLIGYKRTMPNDIVMNRMQAGNGMFARTFIPGLVSPDYAVLRPTTEIDVDYFVQLFKSPLMRPIFRAESKGLGTGTSGFLRLYSDRFGQISMPIPPLSEQASIVAFLNAADRRIGGLIRVKRRLIGLLNERKQAIIHHAVTRGLDLDVPLKPSGIPWLGNVPEHWDVAALNMRYTVQLGKMLDAKQITGDHSVPYLRNVDVQWDRINVIDLPVMDIETDEYERYLVSTGDLLVCEGGDIGRCAFWDGSLSPCGFQKALHRVRPRDKEREASRFLYYVMFAASKFGVFRADGSENTIAHLTNEKLRRHRFGFPPRHEQDAIVSHLDSALTDIELAIDRTRREIDLLREYRTRLIADVVTGKLDVRDVLLPDDGDTDAPEDPGLFADDTDDPTDEDEGVTDADE